MTISPDQNVLFDLGIVQINYGNLMSGGLVAAILLLVAPFVFPVLMHTLEVLTGIMARREVGSEVQKYTR
jgi:hypothetical protein